MLLGFFWTARKAEQQRTIPNADRKHLELSMPLGPHFTFQNRGFWIVHKYLSCFNKTLFNQFHKPSVQEATTYTLLVVHILWTLHIFLWTISWKHKTQRKAFNSVRREFQIFAGGGQLPIKKAQIRLVFEKDEKSTELKYKLHPNFPNLPIYGKWDPDKPF